jgi:hypothetical protein
VTFGDVARQYVWGQYVDELVQQRAMRAQLRRDGLVVGERRCQSGKSGDLRSRVVFGGGLKPVLRFCFYAPGGCIALLGGSFF